jgi:hypothetical protein
MEIKEIKKFKDFQNSENSNENVPDNSFDKKEIPENNCDDNQKFPFKEIMEIEKFKDLSFESEAFVCESCNYKCKYKSIWSRHIASKKHKFGKSSNKMEQKNKQYICKNCNQHYKTLSGLWKHNKLCCTKQNDTQWLKIINDMKDILIEQNNTIHNLVKNGVNNNNNIVTNNSNNKTFNLNFFLNETCKDAMNIDDFVNSIKPSLQDLEETGRLGYAEGITNIIINSLHKTNETIRPIHCSDLKRETIYIKNEDQWIKENENKPILTKAIKTIANENIKNINNWVKEYPDCLNSESRNNDTYLNIVINSMSGKTQEESNKNMNKIISNVAKKITINKH